VPARQQLARNGASLPEASGPYDRPVIDRSTEFGARVARHLREEIVVWMTTVTPDGAPLPMPVWFIWDGAESVVMYSQDGARVRNIESNPRVTLNFAGDGGGGDIAHRDVTRVVRQALSRAGADPAHARARPLRARAFEAG